MMQLNNVAQLCSANLFSDSFPGAQLKISELEGKYISDALTEEFIDRLLDKFEWNRPPNLFNAMILVAQTGKGKNYWVLHTLRAYAADRGKEVIYLCNRVALNRQQIQEADKVVNPIKKPNVISDVSEHRAGSLTIMTYHRFYEKLQKEGWSYFDRFAFCVADEAHFFYSDALFNADTEKILYLIPKVFSKCFRVYMSATPEAVIDPIYAAEWKAMKGDYAPENCEATYSPELGWHGKENLPQIRLYHFPFDFSAYQDTYAFSKVEKLVAEIRNDKTAGKWVVFVTSKDKGKNMKKELTDASISTLYIDRDTRNCNDIETRQVWERIQETGDLGNSKVLITTSVLDNGFSIHDKNVKNIVLFAEDKTEFLQELGRVRLEQGQKVKVYFSRMTKNGRLHPNNRDTILNVFAQYYGNKAIVEYPYPDAEISASPISVLKWQLSPDSNIGFVNAENAKTEDGKNALKPYINNLARWTARKMIEESAEYDKLIAENEDLASVLYKARWLSAEPDKLTFDNLHVPDIDRPNNERSLKEVEAFLEPYLGKVLKEDNKDEETEEIKSFEEFSIDFQKLYLKLYPKDKSTNNGANRICMKSSAINTRLENLHKDISGLPDYVLEKGDEKKEWILKAR